MIVTYTGEYFDYNNIDKDSINVSDIIHALPHINRFVGHSSRPYSVGEHTIRGLEVAEKLGYTTLQKIHWLIHDFTEAYVGDCPTPLKILLPHFSVIEKQVEKAISEHLGLQPMTEKEKELVKRIDNTMLVLEMRDLTLHNFSEFINEQTYIEVIQDNSYRINNEPFSHKGYSSIRDMLRDSYIELMYQLEREIKLEGKNNMKKFNINASIKTDNYFDKFSKVLEFENQEKAIEYAKETAREMYYLNPLFDVLEIKLVRKVNEEKAIEIFNKQMEENIKYSAEDIS